MNRRDEVADDPAAQAVVDTAAHRIAAIAFG